MKFKKIMLVTFVLLAILTIGAASAADDAASDDLAVEDIDEVSVDASQDDLTEDSEEVLASSEEEIITNDDEGYNITFNGNGPYDQCDDDETHVVDITVPEGSEAKVIVTAEGIADEIVDEDIDDIDQDDNTGIYYLVPDSFDLDDGTYVITVKILKDGNEVASQTGTLTFNGNGIDAGGTEFKAEVWDNEPMLFFWDYILDVYCPDGKTGIITVAVKDEYGEEVYTSNKSVADADEEGMLSWTLAELKLTSVGNFTLEVTHDGDEIDNFDIEVTVPFWIEDTTYIGGTDNNGYLVSVFLPTDIDNATIFVSIEDKLFTFTLDDFVFVEDGDGSKPIWFYPSFGPNPDMNQKSYVISNNNLEFGFEEKTYEVNVRLMVEGVDDIIDGKDVEFLAVNVGSNDNVTIEFYKGKHAFNHGDSFVTIIKEGECEGYILITVADSESRKEIPLADIDGFEYIEADDFEYLGEGDFEINVAYYDENDELVFNVTGSVHFYYDDDGGDGDAEDGVVIWVATGDEGFEFDLTDPDDLDDVFATVSVRDDLDGRIVILIWNDEEGDEQEFFGKDLDEITNKEDDPDYEGFTIYKLSLNDLGNYDDLIDCGSFRLAFVDDGDDEIDSRSYDIECDEDIVIFWENDDDDDEEIHGEGDKIEATFTNANILDNGAVVTISKDDLPDVDNNFTVIIPQEEGEPTEITLKLDEIIEGDNYVIRVNDLQLPEFKESYDILIILQFYKDGSEAYYAEWMDEREPIHIYESPCIFNETSIFSDDEVITIQEIPEGVDEFQIIISKEGSQDIVKTFKFSELVDDWKDIWVSFKLADLGINKTGEYEITVKYRNDLTYSGNLNVTKNVDIRTHECDDDGDLKTFRSVDGLVVNFRISEKVTGYVKIYVNETQVGENINLADLPVGSVPPDDGRQIILNDLNITQSGEYTVKVELYSNADVLLGDVEFNILVEVGESSVEINGGSYPYGTEASDEIIEYVIGSPLLEGQYFNIYFNSKKAGVITSNGLEFNDEFTVRMFDALLFKPGKYDVNVTFFDGENETDVTTGSFSINELTLTSDKEVYIFEKDSVIISFNMDSVADDDSLRAFYVYGWGPVGRYDDFIFNPYGGNQLKEDGLYEDGVISFDVAWITDEEDIDHYRLDVGTTLIYVEYGNDTGRFGGFIEVNVVGVDPNLTISVDDIREGTDAVITITTNSTFSGYVKVQIDDKYYIVHVTNGRGSYSVSGLAVGNYTAVATFEATGVFNASTKSTTFKVNKAIIPDPETAISTNYTSTSAYPVYSISLGPDATGKFAVKIGEKVYEKELKNGAAVIEVSGIPAGTYETVISYSGDSKYAPISKTVNSTVKVATVIKATAVTTTYGTSKNIVITLTDVNGKVLVGKNVTVVFNGAKKVLTTDAKGQVSYAVGTNLAVEKYDATFTFDGDANYVKSTGTVKVTVNKAKAKLTFKKYTATLKTDKGKALKKAKVTLTGKFKGKKIKITKKTNSKGKAKFNLKKLIKKGKFTGKVKFAGNKYYEAASKKVKVTVKK